jgi:tetratricopeptide (TPR) repeat protein
MTLTPFGAVVEDLRKAPADFDRPLISAATVVASILRHAGNESPKGTLLNKAVRHAKRALGAAALERGCRDDDGAAETPVQVIRLLAEKASREGFVNLARETLEGLRRSVSNQRDCGRIDIDIARQWRVQGQLDLAEAQLRRTRATAKALRHADTAAYATLGLAACAQVRGNLQQMRKLAREGARSATKLGLRRLSASSYMGVGNADAMAKDYSSAMTHLWRAYRLGAGQPLLQHEALVNLTQVLLVAGQPAEAQRLAASLLRQRLPARFAMPTLGSYAVASAHLQKRADVLWAAAQAERFCGNVVFPRETATLLVEAGLALSAIGETRDGTRLNAQGERIAIEFGFFDLTFTEGIATITAPPARPSRLLSDAKTVIASVRRIPGKRPSRVLLAAA